MQIRTLKSLVASAACAFGIFAISAGVNAAPILNNGDFETGDFTGWTQFGNTTYAAVDIQFPQAGTYGAYFGSTPEVGGIKQTLVTIPTQFYKIDFWLMSEVDAAGLLSTPNSFNFSWGGTNEMTLTNVSPSPYTLYTFVLQATSDSTELMFAFENTPAFWDLDSVSVIQTTDPSGELPEPGSLALVGLAGVVAGIVRRKRSQRYPN